MITSMQVVILFYLNLTDFASEGTAYSQRMCGYGLIWLLRNLPV